MHASIKKSTADLTRDTVVGIFPDEHSMRDVSSDLINRGFGRGNIHTSSEVAGGLGPDGGIMDWLRSLFGSDSDEEMGHYAEAVRRGRCLVVVTVDRANRDRVADIMNDHDAIDIDRDVASYRAAGYTGYDPNAGPFTPPETAAATLPQQDREPGAGSGDVIQEELEADKRVIQRGGVRVYTHVARKS